MASWISSSASIADSGPRRAVGPARSSPGGPGSDQRARSRAARRLRCGRGSARVSARQSLLREAALRWCGRRRVAGPRVARPPRPVVMVPDKVMRIVFARGCSLRSSHSGSEIGTMRVPACVVAGSDQPRHDSVAPPDPGGSGEFRRGVREVRLRAWHSGGERRVSIASQPSRRPSCGRCHCRFRRASSAWAVPLGRAWSMVATVARTTLSGAGSPTCSCVRAPGPPVAMPNRR